MTHGTRGSSRGAFPALLTLFLMTFAAACGGAAQTTEKTAAASSDPLAAEIERAAAFLQSEAASQGIGARFQEGSLRELARAREALRAGRRSLAMFRFAAVKANIATVAAMNRRADKGKDMAGFEAEWARMGDELRGDLGAPSAAAFDGVRPAAVRAVAEAALPQVRGFFEASREFAHATSPNDGLFYLANAEAQREVVQYARSLAAPTSRREPPLRSIAPELDALEAEMLAAYRPPASIEKHPQYIAASSALKEARELDAAGLRYGALLRYLQAAVRFVPIRETSAALEGEALTRRLGEHAARLAAGDTDQSLGRLFLELARADVDDAAPGTRPTFAAGIAADVLPRYFAALEPARPAPPKPAPRATVTLVRWPYT